ncbi:TlyA family RNA methyltransferase [Microbacterium sp.]|uniref:TlyA family RNA methyltransferase n=1 Tax=Microbacterium sp. TaxID=51671 RepID=UPI0039E4C98A
MRLDAAVAARGLARSRTHAARLISAGLVEVDGVAVVKPAAPVADDAAVVVAATDHYVSRAAHKLIAGLDAFGVDVAGRGALDIGASTGGFTQVLRERGAEPVVALDVGHGQFAAELAADRGIVVVEGFNARDLTPGALAAASGTRQSPTVITGDLSFISLTRVLDPIAAVAAPDADIVLLIKPQFEVGRTGVREGLVTDPRRRADAVATVLWAAWDAGLGTFGLIRSPVVGTHGNVEFVVHLRTQARAGDRPDGNPTEWMSTVDRWAGER